MKKLIYPFIIIILLTACGTTPYNLDDNFNATYPPEAETIERDFVYRVFTEKDVYNKFSDLAIFAELTYVGENDFIEITHAASPFYFPLEETTRGYKMDYNMDQPLNISKLIKGEPLRERYVFSGGYSETSGKEYVKFINQMIHKGFPVGQYIIDGYAKFSILDTITSETEHFMMNAKIGFTVNENPYD